MRISRVVFLVSIMATSGVREFVGRIDQPNRGKFVQEIKLTCKRPILSVNSWVAASGKPHAYVRFCSEQTAAAVTRKFRDNKNPRFTIRGMDEFKYLHFQLMNEGHADHWERTVETFRAQRLASRMMPQQPSPPNTQTFSPIVNNHGGELAEGVGSFFAEQGQVAQEVAQANIPAVEDSEDLNRSIRQYMDDEEEVDDILGD